MADVIVIGGGGAGLLVPPGDTYALAAGIIRLLEDERLRRDLGAFARRRAERVFNWANTAAAILSLYEIRYPWRPGAERPGSAARLPAALQNCRAGCDTKGAFGG